MKYTLEEIRKVLEKKEYQFFDGSIPYTLNLIGIRSDNARSNRFDDHLALIYRDDQLRIRHHEYPITTDPGRYWLRHPKNTKGTFILAPGQHWNMWRVGLHKGQYQALVQCNPVAGYRDNNQDDIIDIIPENKVKGMYGINLHRSNPYDKSYYVNKWSAGCQVHQSIANFDDMMSIVLMSESMDEGQTYNYTLLEEKDFTEYAERKTT